jgi:hypothetical protein
MTTATSDKKIASNRANASHSTGPRTEAGKAKVRLNALKHGFRAEDLVLPTEDPAQFEAFRQAWHDDWKPCNQTRFQLVEQLVADSWRLRRCVRVETTRLRSRAHMAINAHNDSIEIRLDKGRRLLDMNQEIAGLKLLDDDRAGLEAQIAMWLDLADSASCAEHWWDPNKQHARLLTLLGFSKYAKAQDVGPVAIDSWQLVVHNDPTAGDYIDAPIDDAGAEELFNSLAEVMQDELATLRGRLEGFAESDVLDDRVAEISVADDSPEGRMALRYEGQHDRSFRAALNLLIKLIQTGVDLVPDPEVETIIEVPAEPVAVPIKAKEPAALPSELPIKASPKAPRSKKKRRGGRNRQTEENGIVREHPQLVI